MSLVSQVLLNRKRLAKSALGACILVLVVFALRDTKRFGPLPVSFSLPVAFTTQAPDGTWRDNENCEEASAIMANAYLTGYIVDRLTISSTQESIQMLVAWERERFGHADNNGLDEMDEMIETVFHLNTTQINDFTEVELKRELLAHHVLILPISMKLLGNPEYPPDQKYHVFVIRGYTSKGFLVNDPGLSDGKNNLYSFETLRAAAVDWNSDTQELMYDNVTVLSVWK